MVEVRRRASEAKGPFPGGKRVGSWGKKKNKRKEKAKEKAKEKVLLLRAKSQKKTPSTSMRWMGLGCFKVTKKLAHEYAAGVSWIAAVE